MSANSERVRTLIAEEAAQWFIANRAGMTARDRNAFGDWLKASPLHVQEYLAISVIARDMPGTRADSDESLEALVDRARVAEDIPSIAPSLPFSNRSGLAPSAWRTAAVPIAVSGILVVGTLAFMSLHRTPHTPPSAGATELHFATAHGEQQTYELGDHSVLHLNTDTAVTVRYTKTDRRVTLTSGEAFFEVAHEPRTFVVQAGAAEIMDIGTKFNVRLRQDATTVTVLSGRVAVGSPSISGGSVPGSNESLPKGYMALGAGQQVSIADAQMPASPVAVDTERTTAWLHRQIIFEHEPLQRVASEFNRYARKPIEIVTPALQTLEISGAFSTDDPEAFIAFLRSLDGVVVEVTPTRIRISQK